MKLIAIDLDGTLLNSQKEITEDNLKAIEQAQSLGVTIVIATGRFAKDAWKITKKYNLNTWHICSNGAAIYTPDDQLISSISMDHHDVIEALKWLSDNDYYFEVATDKHIHAWHHHHPTLIKELNVLKLRDPAVDTTRLHNVLNLWKTQKELRDIATIDSLMDLKEDWHNILTIVFDPQKRQQAMAHFKEWGRLTVSYSWLYNFELMSPTVSKGNALKTLGDRLGIHLSDMMAIGDNHNDLSMLSTVGFGVAMGNSSREVQEACSFTTRSYEESGVAYAINHKLRNLL